MIMRINLIQLTTGKKATVAELLGDLKFAGRLEAMGITPGTEIQKKSATLMRGPVIVQRGTMQVAIGYGMAKKVIVEFIDK